MSREAEELSVKLVEMKLDTTKDDDLDAEMPVDKDQGRRDAEFIPTFLSWKPSKDELADLKKKLSKGGSAGMPTLNMLVDGGSEHFINSLLNKEHYLSVLQSACADDYYIKLAEACYFCARQAMGFERKRLIFEGSLAAMRGHVNDKNKPLAMKLIVLLGLQRAAYLPLESREDYYRHLHELLTDAREAMPGNCILEHCHARFSVDFQRFKAMTGGIYHNFHDDCLNVLIEARKELPLFLKMENLYYIFICCLYLHDYTKMNALLPLPHNTVIYDQGEAEYLSELLQLM